MAKEMKGNTRFPMRMFSRLFRIEKSSSFLSQICCLVTSACCDVSISTGVTGLMSCPPSVVTSVVPSPPTGASAAMMSRDGLMFCNLQAFRSIKQLNSLVALRNSASARCVASSKERCLSCCVQATTSTSSISARLSLDALSKNAPSSLTTCVLNESTSHIPTMTRSFRNTSSAFMPQASMHEAMSSASSRLVAWRVSTTCRGVRTAWR